MRILNPASMAKGHSSNFQPVLILDDKTVFLCDLKSCFDYGVFRGALRLRVTRVGTRALVTNDYFDCCGNRGSFLESACMCVP